MKRIILLVLALLASCQLAEAGPNGSTDGRFHTCGFVTEQGVTEHLDAYHIRCDQEVDR